MMIVTKRPVVNGPVVRAKSGPQRAAPRAPSARQVSDCHESGCFLRICRVDAEFDRGLADDDDVVGEHLAKVWRVKTRSAR